MADEMVSLAERCRRVELLVLDVDGVLTDGRIIYDDRGAESAHGLSDLRPCGVCGSVDHAGRPEEIRGRAADRR